MTDNPDSPFMAQVARNLTVCVDGTLREQRHRPHGAVVSNELVQRPLQATSYAARA